MKYRSTRGGIEGISFEDAVMRGLAEDGGLFVPHSIPEISWENLKAWKSLSFHELSAKILRLFIAEEEISTKQLEEITSKSFATFSHKLVTPLTKISKNLYILELFHGPTFAFKDVALQFLGNLFEFFLERRGGQDYLTIVGATSGDTGSAAIYGLRGKKNIEVYILYPKGRVSPIQEKQMTTVLDENVHNIALECTFDDCQNIVKDLFNDLEFKAKHHLGAINSINWARILAQIVYYVFAFLQTRKSVEDFLNPEIQFSVPTGNFGDVLAGYYAACLGIPIKKLLVATNKNDILDRFFETGRYERLNEATITLSPAMDIQISSNFERYLFYLSGSDGKILKEWMETFKNTSQLSVDAKLWSQARATFISCSISDEETLDCIKRYHEKRGSDQIESYIVCPHTAVGVAAAEKKLLSNSDERTITICLATAHPAKFGEAVNKAIGRDPPMPDALKHLEGKESRVHFLSPTVIAIKKFILTNKPSTNLLI